ncbi:proton-coupled folate transporter-like [Diorhabda carinulata]|uniref:proton-coupled folate transporter-like n=1 Tax=Diorhabda carinulata TaxID=1163345 RepID=UPI0025A2C09E|nr:proton-coupled folate transporter-like [Diorhabda carinulata]XP_057664106.1 proton-coupled folate transporter-like [Diorhabda carinulata]
MIGSADTKSEAEKKASKEKEANFIDANMTWKDRYNFFVENITVEPMLACYIVPSVLASLATQNLNLEKACRVNLGYSPEVCDALTERRTENYTMEEREVQQLVASMGVWKTVLQSALPAFLIMFIGSWSDRWGKRKPCMLFPIVGEFMTVVGLMVCTYFFQELPMEVSGFIEGFFPAITGGWFTMFMGIFSYIGDVTTLDVRTLRIGIVNVFCSLGIPIGLALSGILYKKIGFYGTFSLSAVMYIMAFYYGYKSIKEPKKLDRPTLPNQPCALIRDFFDVKHLLDTFRVAFKKGENKRRKKVMLLMLVVMVVIGPMHGEMSVGYLFTRYRFNWDEVDFSIFSTYSMVTNLIGTSFSVGVFSHVLKFDDAIIGIYSSMSKILSSFVYGFAKTSLVFYLGAIVEILNGTSFIAMRSIASKLVPTDELGKVNSLFGVCEALMPLLYGPMYNATYAATLQAMPGAFYILGGILTVPAVIIFAWMYLQSCREAKESSKLNHEKRNSVVANVILNTAVRETQIVVPIDVSTGNGVTNNKTKENGTIKESKQNGVIHKVDENIEGAVGDGEGIKNLAFNMEEN